MDAVKGPLVGVTESNGRVRRIRTSYFLATATRRHPSSPAGSGTGAFRSFSTYDSQKEGVG